MGTRMLERYEAVPDLKFLRKLSPDDGEVVAGGVRVQLRAPGIAEDQVRPHKLLLHEPQHQTW
jgi:hypothetical protein